MIIDFGIPELDELIGRFDDGRGISVDPTESVSIGIVGADGTGKSVLALHLASRYAARYPGNVVYFSEDLGHQRANRVFEAFGLDEPVERCAELGYESLSRNCRSHIGLDLIESDHISAESKSPGRISFIDLQARTTGDDWAFVLENVARLPRITDQALRSGSVKTATNVTHIVNQASKIEPGTLACVFIDNIDALQMVNAGVDQFGEERTRWSRLDQLINLAKGRCHLVLISGEPDPGTHLDEQYAVDYVLHLRVVEREARYTERMLEVEKARGQVNVRGMHAFVFRSGEGTTTGYQTNPDFPAKRIEGKPKPLSYVRVFHSLDYIYSKVMGSAWQGYIPGSGETVKFARLDRLNELLPNGVICGGSVVALIGPRQTFKGDFVAAFEAGAFQAWIEKSITLKEDELLGKDVFQYWIETGVNPTKNPLLDKHPNMRLSNIFELATAFGIAEKVYAASTTNGLGREATNLAELYRQYSKGAESDYRQLDAPVVVHLTTEDVDSWQVAYRIARSATRFPADFEKAFGLPSDPNKTMLAHIEARLICRRMEIHANSSAVLFAIISECVQAAIRKAFPKGSALEQRPSYEMQKAGRIIVTVGDWTQIEERYPEVAKDTKFLPLLLFHLKRLGVTTLVTESRADSSALPSVYQSRSHLAQDADQTLFTWRVMNDSRVAIAAVPQARVDPHNPGAHDVPNDGRTQVWEVRAETELTGRIVIDPALERYHGLESGNPKLVKLHLKLLGQTPAQRLYAKEMARLLTDLAEDEQSDGAVVHATDELEYELLRDVTYLLGNTRLSHTQIVMIDEFWESDDSLIDLTRFLTTVPDETQLKLFYRKLEHRNDAFEQADTQVNHRGSGAAVPDPFCTKIRSHRIPYTWDFGFLLTTPDAWRGAYHERIQMLKARADGTVNREPIELRTIAHLLRFARRHEKGQYETDSERSSITGPYLRSDDTAAADTANKSGLVQDLLGWRVFLEACCVVANSSDKLKMKPFDIDLTAPETLASTVLEIWLSELRFFNKRSQVTSDSVKISAILKDLNSSDSAPGCGLPQLLEFDLATIALYFALRLLAEVFDSEMLVANSTGFDIAPRRPFRAAAVRHWYSTAVRAAHEDDASSYTAIRLPGSYSTRGDWHLAVTKGSKSLRVAYDALDKLSSIRANFDRLQSGVGLPTRGLPEPEYIRTALATISRPTAMPGMTYDNLTLLGAAHDSNFDWLFRSRLKGYRLHSTPFRKWIFRVLRDMVNKRTNRLTSHLTTFEVYDEFLRAYNGSINNTNLVTETGIREDFERFKDDVHHIVRIFTSTSDE